MRCEIRPGSATTDGYDNIRLSFAALHITRVAIGLSADTTFGGVDARDVSTSIPLPVLSFALTYKVAPEFVWYIKSEFFTLAFDDWKGNYIDGTLGMEYRAFKHVGLGIGLGSNSLKLSEETSEYKFSYANRIAGAFIYAAAYF